MIRSPSSSGPVVSGPAVAHQCDAPGFPLSTLKISPLPFEPAANESHKAFETFLCYFDIGQNRSFAKVARLSGVNLNSVKQWAHRFDWRDRVRAYNPELLRARLAVETDARRNSAALRAERTRLFQDAEWKAAEKLLRAAQNSLDVLLQKTPEKLSLSDVARALEIASKLGRLATGLSTEHVEHAGEVNVNLQLEIESAIKKVYGPVVDCPSLAGAGEGGAIAPGEDCGEETDPVGHVTPCAPLVAQASSSSSQPVVSSPVLRSPPLNPPP